MDFVSRFAHARALARIQSARVRQEDVPEAAPGPEAPPTASTAPVSRADQDQDQEQDQGLSLGSLRARLELHGAASDRRRLGAAPVQSTERPPRTPRAQRPSRPQSTHPFERRVETIALARRGRRPELLGACLAGLELPRPAAFARDLLCLGAARGSRPAIIDLESTGLRGAAVPFVIGIAWFEEDRVEVLQWTLERVGGEAEMLADLFGELGRRGADPLVSFNGASFDLPLLRARAARHGLGASEIAADVDHVDLLHPARRLFRGDWDDCRLGTLERRLLGLRRHGDIAGAEIPEVFWDFARARTEPVDEGELAEARARMHTVREHNLVDLVSLPALAGRLAAQLRSPDSLERARRAARHWQRLGSEEQARRLLAGWVEPGLDTANDNGGGGGQTRRVRDPAWREAALELATLERRARGLPRAARLWEAAWRCDRGCPTASDAWAKYLEHHAGDFGRALEVAESSRLPCPQRIARLQRRLARASSGSEPEIEPEAELEIELEAVGEPRLEASSTAARVPEAPVPVAVGVHQPPGQPETTPTRPTSVPLGPCGLEVSLEESNQRTSEPGLSRRERPNSGLLRSVEDAEGVRLRYRLLR